VKFNIYFSVNNCNY